MLLAVVTAHLILVFYLKHTQWAGRGRTERNAVGKPMFPQFMAASGGLFFITFGVLTLLAAVAQINPVWTYGPYRPDQVSTGSQPDWYVGFLEGSLRLVPPWETTLAGHTLMWNVLLPAVVLPLGLFAVLYAYPFAERWLTGDTGEHHLCDRPRDRPVRTGHAAPLSSLGALAAAFRFLSPADGGALGHDGVNVVGSVHPLHVKRQPFERLGGTGRVPRPAAQVGQVVPSGEDLGVVFAQRPHPLGEQLLGDFHGAGQVPDLAQVVGPVPERHGIGVFFTQRPIPLAQFLLRLPEGLRRREGVAQHSLRPHRKKRGPHRRDRNRDPPSPRHVRHASFAPRHPVGAHHMVSAVVGPSSPWTP
jgi:hypothetical protein